MFAHPAVKILILWSSEAPQLTREQSFHLSLGSGSEGRDRLGSLLESLSKTMLNGHSTAVFTLA